MANGERIFQFRLDGGLDTLAIPPVAEAEDLFIVRHEVDFELAKLHAANDVVFGRFSKAALAQLIQQFCPLGKSRKVDDQVDVVRGPDPFERDGIGDVERCCTTADKHQTRAEVIAEGHRDGLQHILELALQRHPNLSFNMSEAKLASR